MKKHVLFALLLTLAAFGIFGQEIYSVKNASTPIAGKKTDIDFTKMNFNMASGIVFDMMIEPEKYVGKIVKIKGLFNSEIYEGKRTFAVFVWDATGCCPTGLTVVPLAEKKYPEDFPKDQSLVTVTGVMESLDIFSGSSLCLVAQAWE